MTNRPQFAPVPSEGLTWLTKARCANPQPDEPENLAELFFVDAGRTITDEALSLCRTECPVRQACITHAYTRGADGGMIGAGYFGGLSLGQRKSMTLEQALAFAEQDSAQARAEKEVAAAQEENAPTLPLTE